MTHLQIYGNPIKKLDTDTLRLILPSIQEIEISADTLDHANLEECDKWLRSNNGRLILNPKSASNITNLPKRKTATIRSFPKPPLTYNTEEKEIYLRMEHSETKIKEMSEEIGRLNTKFYACVYFFASTFGAIMICVILKPCFYFLKDEDRIIWRREPGHELLHNLIEAEESL